MRSIALFVLMLACLALGGCVAIAAGAAGAGTIYGLNKYEKNLAFRDYDASLEGAWTATLETLGTNGFPVPANATLGVTEGTVKAGEAWVRVEKYSETRTRVWARVGTFENRDNKRRARLLLDGISAKLAPPN